MSKKKLPAFLYLLFKDGREPTREELGDEYFKYIIETSETKREAAITLGINDSTLWRIEQRMSFEGQK